MSEDSDKGPCVCGCYGSDHKNRKGKCVGWHFGPDGRRVDCDCKKFVLAVERNGYGAKNREQDMIESVGKLLQHSMIMEFESAEDNDKTDFRILRDRLSKLRRDISEMTFAYGE